MKNQIDHTEEVLFNNYMVSSVGEENVHCQIPFYFNRDIQERMVFYSEEINKISLEILSEIKGRHKDVLNYFEDFPYKDKIFNLKIPISPMFWTRYDTFIDDSNNIYFAELNYDKPCGQKEMELAGKSPFQGNLNTNFIDKFIKELHKIVNDFCGEEDKINVGMLMDPCHYEELHHSYYFKNLLKDTKINIVQVGPNNLSVIDGEVYAFSEIKLPIILRLFPTEFFYEIDNIEEILDAFDNGKVLLINDPRIIAIQAKGFFAYLWKLVEEESKLLSKENKDVIRACIPYTKIYKGIDKETLINKDKYVVKSSLGRYSQEVYIGKLYDRNAWKNQLEIVEENKKLHILQDLIEIRQEYTFRPAKENMNIPNLAYGNFGVYLIKDKVEGFLVRWSKSFLTDDNYTWMCPLGVRDSLVSIEEYSNEDRKEIWEKVMEEAAFSYSFTGTYTNVSEYISLDSFIVEKSLYEEMNTASSLFIDILDKAYPYIQRNIELFGPILGIPESLYELVSKSCTTALCALGRIDFALDNNGELKILEFNSETPAGLVESVGINSIIKKELGINYEDPNESLINDIAEAFKFVLKDLKKEKEIKVIGVVTSWYYEDIYTSEVLFNILKGMEEYKVVFGNIYDLKVAGDKIYLYGKEIDAIYRHYPLDWLDYEKEMNQLIKPLSSGTYLINPGHTLITQSKAFLGVIHELVGKGFFTDEEDRFILKYIPYTCLEPDNKLSSDCVVKPYLSREGLGVIMSYEGVSKELEDIVFQDRVNITPLNININSTMGCSRRYQFPIMGVYITNKKPSGLYTRMGDFITNSNAIFMPTYIR
ncbi:glutathionylspermidine synthase family protein [Clostridium paraputrificum]|uniref:glutathionylspermidine synthase family protein n=1 Tax=Clostridium paraputrificum TaxID=29363 RepID=UPI003D33B361